MLIIISDEIPQHIFIEKYEKCFWIHILIGELDIPEGVCCHFAKGDMFTDRKLLS